MPGLNVSIAVSAAYFPLRGRILLWEDTAPPFAVASRSAAWLVYIIGAKPVAGAGSAAARRDLGDSPYRLMFSVKGARYLCGLGPFVMGALRHAEPGEDQLPSAGAGGKAGAEAGAAEGIWSTQSPPCW